MSTKENYCIYQITKYEEELQFNCTVVGTRRDITIAWTGASDHSYGPLSYSDKGDGTYEATATIRIKAGHIKSENFTCFAEGLSINGTAMQTIHVVSAAGAHKTNY